MASPIRRIVHVDMDAFYASVEQRDQPDLKGKPVAVGGKPEGRGVVAAASYEAREFGVHSALSMAKAVRLCPSLVIIRPDFAKYRAVSKQVFELFRTVTPAVEPLSLDEAYLDVTTNTWNEPLATTVAKRLKAEILHKTSLTASAGVAPNKFLAKIASAWKKPDGLTVIAPERVETFLQKLPVEALWGVGPVTARKLRTIGIKRLVDLRTIDNTELKKAIGSQAASLKQLAHGIDNRPVVGNRSAKSHSSERTYAADLSDITEIRIEIERMALANAHWLSQKNLYARTVTLKVRYSDFKTVTRNDTHSTAINDGRQIASRAQILVDRTNAAHQPVRLLGVGVHGLVQRNDASARTSRPLLWDSSIAPANPSSDV